MSVQEYIATGTCRLLYYGQVGVGKRENLRLIHKFVPPELRLAVAVDDPERQIAFNLQQEGQEARQILVQAVDVGREQFHAAGMVQRLPFDAVVFVVDSGVSHLENSLAAFESLKMYLESWGLDLMRIPVVLQYNRLGGEDTLPVDQLESMLNPWGLLSFPAHSARGEGVRETLKAALGLAVNHQKEVASKMPHVPTQEQGFMPQGADHGDGPAPEPAKPEVPVPGRESSLQLDYGPALPGREIENATRLRTEQIFNDLRPPLIIPVKIPRRLLGNSKGPLRIMLEVEIED